ncbi:MAG: prolipoprotein diacylglyceryl transferase [Rickettsiales bacterium]|nr:prolipoprotein diacylglyceryl transferase [Rickettsiales bacterium]
MARLFLLNKVFLIVFLGFASLFFFEGLSFAHSDKEIEKNREEYKKNLENSQILEGFLEEMESLDVPKYNFSYKKIDPVALDLGFFQIKWYSLAYLFGVLFGWWYAKYLNRKFLENPIKTEVLDNLPMWIILSIIIGGRVGYVFFYNFEYYIENPLEALQIWNGGMSFHGGLIGVIIGTYLYARKYKLPYLQVTDLVACVAPIGIFLGRIANYINNELRGRFIEDSELYWGVYYKSEPFLRHPSQFYEAFSEGLLILIILFFVAKFKPKSSQKYLLNLTGLCSALFLILYSIFRAICENYRDPDLQLGFLYGNWLTMGMILCIPSLLLGLFIFYNSLWNRKKK